ncbi:MAG: ABC transporter ATP-binding protein [Clostridiales bacterium]|nr:ABC transporter ATP-binding protein [Clostridiales bacterium]
MLKIQNLTKIYGKSFTAVDNLTLRVAPGDIFGFIGHNGAGKTTTLRCVAGILEYESGEIFINGIPLAEDPLACKRVMRYIPDNPDLYEHLKGIAYLNFLADIYGLDAQTRTSRIAKYADAFEMTARLGDSIGAMSHGMKQKMAVIGALIGAPKLLLLDEPFVGLDPIAAHTLKQIMRDMTNNGAAILFSTHILEVAEKLCNKVAIIQKGKLIVAGDMETVRGDVSLEELFLELSENRA